MILSIGTSIVSNRFLCSEQKLSLWYWYGLNVSFFIWLKVQTDTKLKLLLICKGTYVTKYLLFHLKLLLVITSACVKEFLCVKESNDILACSKTWPYSKRDLVTEFSVSFSNLTYNNLYLFAYFEWAISWIEKHHYHQSAYRSCLDRAVPSLEK